LYPETAGQREREQNGFFCPLPFITSGARAEFEEMTINLKVQCALGDEFVIIETPLMATRWMGHPCGVPSARVAIDAIVFAFGSTIRIEAKF
jgi:hypothetical protein